MSGLNAVCNGKYLGYVALGFFGILGVRNISTITAMFQMGLSETFSNWPYIKPGCLLASFGPRLISVTLAFVSYKRQWSSRVVLMNWALIAMQGLAANF